MACCNNDLGMFPHNKEINTGIVAPDTGTYLLFFTGPNFSKFTKALHLVESDDIVIPQGVLNEDCLYSLVITKPDGDNLEVSECANFSFQTYVNTIACDDIEYL